MITLEEAKAHLRVEAPAEDAAIQVYIAAAEQFIRDYTGQEFTDEVPAAIKAAALLQVGSLYEQREGGVQGETYQYTGLVRELLNPHRLLDLA